MSQHTGGTHVEACGRSPRNGSNRSLGWSQRWFDSTAEHMEEEEWRPLPAAPEKYEISSHGNARRSAPGISTYPGRQVKVNVAASTGYPMINVYVDGRPWRITVHRQMCIAFHGEPLPGQVARHLDDVKLNNHVSNLAWGSRVDNAADALRNGRLPGTSTHCRNGHAYTDASNARLATTGRRRCTECLKAYKRRRNERAREENGVS